MCRSNCIAKTRIARVYHEPIELKNRLTYFHSYQITLYPHGERIKFDTELEMIAALIRFRRDKINISSVKGLLQISDIVYEDGMLDQAWRMAFDKIDPPPSFPWEVILGEFVDDNMRKIDVFRLRKILLIQIYNNE